MNITDIEMLRKAAAEHPGHWVFRGQACAGWRLVPAIARLVGVNSVHIAEAEEKAITTFRSLAQKLPQLDLAERLLLQSDKNSTALVMRHYGGATRALDWSNSFWVAACFASADRPLCDSAVWAVEYDVYATSAAKHRSHRFFKVEGKGFVGDRLFLPEAPPHVVFVHIEPPARFARVRAQEGLFSVTSRIDADHGQALLAYMPTASLRRWVIPAAIKARVLDECQRHGVTLHTLYPDLDGAIRSAERHFADLQRLRCVACRIE
jgi:hypothetical protein